MSPQELQSALQWRYAVKIFDASKTVSEPDLHEILEAGRLSPSSYGVESWKFIVVKNPELRNKLRAVSFDQPKVTDAAYLIVIAYRTDGENMGRELAERVAKASGKAVEELHDLQDMVDGDVAGKKQKGTLDAWLKAQSYIPLGIMIETAALMNIDAGPMEGFDSDKVDELLGLREQNLHATTMLALGHRGSDPAAERPKVRRSFEEVVRFVE